MQQMPQDWFASNAVDEEVDHLLSQWTLADKVALVSGQLAVQDNGSVSTLPPALPLLALADGPGGLRLANPTLPDHRATALPAPIALAATWSPELAAAYGSVLGAEASATGHNILLAPAMDIARAPRAGRTFESFGEDPLLQSRMAAAEVAAIQSQGVLACIKHYLANNQEYQRSTIDVLVDERTLHELYAPPFAAAVRSGAAAVMGSYNRINGVYACENPAVLTTILREQLGFRGFVMSDYLATQSTAASAKAGLDWELGVRMWGPQLLAAVERGEVAAATVDEMVRRILRPIVGLGLVDATQRMRPIPVQEHGAQALAIAEQAIVLLKNDGPLLPWRADSVRSIAVIGPDADNVSGAGGGSGFVQPTYGVSVLEGIRRRVGESVAVEYAPGVDPVGTGALIPGPHAIPAAFFATGEQTPAGSGLTVAYWDNAEFAGEPVAVRREARAELNYGFYHLFPGPNAASPKLPARPTGLSGRISVRWSGLLTAPADGETLLALTCLGTARLHLDGKLLIDTAAMPAADQYSPTRLPAGLPAGAPDATIRTVTATAHLAAGMAYPVVVEYAADVPGFWIFGEALLRLGWQPPAGVVEPAIAEAAALAAASDVAVVVARTFEMEETDRPDLRLPNRQDDLIRAVAAANPATVVVLMNAGPVEVGAWEGSVPAIVEAWFAGQEQGNAIARVLFGDINPSGRLPITFAASEGKTPLATPAQYPGVHGAVHYSEGVFAGYRGYDRLGIEPQYPFGHGLSYTSFAYTDLRVTPEVGDGTTAIRIQFELDNRGEVAGTEVAQVYLSPPHWQGAKRLAGWTRLHLAPGERQLVTVTLDGAADEHPFSTWDAATHAWQTVAGEYQVQVGASARDLRLTGKVGIVWS